MPLLSARDPATSVEGTLDPLGLYQIANELGVKLIPGVRERMSHPRFLTLTAVSAAVCGEFDEELVATDGVTSPQQVFEWHVVEGLVRRSKEDGRLSGLPGRDKVGRAVDDGVALSARTYLKTPSVFGFHGVYRLLARSLDIEADGRLGDAGYRLLDTWRKEQGLTGFGESTDGVGSACLKLWRDAVTDGLAKGAVDRSPSWQGWDFIARHLGPHDAGTKEQRMLAELIFGSSQGFTREFMTFLRSEAGKVAYREVHDRHSETNVWSEHAFHDALKSQSSGPLRELLDAIRAYETFARLLQDAFDECLHVLSDERARLRPDRLANGSLVKRATQRVPDAYARAIDALAPVGESERFLRMFSSLADRLPPADWLERLLELHRNVQLNKPPNGKLPWLERFDDGGFMVRPGYTRDHGGRGDGSYVHAYRLGSLWSFAKDLGAV